MAAKTATTPHAQFGAGYAQALSDVFSKITEELPGGDTAALDAALEWIGNNAQNFDTRQAISLLRTRRTDRAVAANVEHFRTVELDPIEEARQRRRTRGLPNS